MRQPFIWSKRTRYNMMSKRCWTWTGNSHCHSRVAPSGTSCYPTPNTTIVKLPPNRVRTSVFITESPHTYTFICRFRVFGKGAREREGHLVSDSVTCNGDKNDHLKTCIQQHLKITITRTHTPTHTHEHSISSTSTINVQCGIGNIRHCRG